MPLDPKQVNIAPTVESVTGRYYGDAAPRVFDEPEVSFDETLAAVDAGRRTQSFYGEVGQAERDPQLRAMLEISERYQREFGDDAAEDFYLSEPQSDRAVAKRELDDEYRGTVKSFFASIFSDEETSGREFARKRAQERIAALRKVPNANAATLDRLQANLDMAFSHQGKAAYAATLKAQADYLKDTTGKSGFWQSAGAEIVHLADPSRRVELGAIIATAPIGMKATIAGTAVRFAGLGLGITSVEELPRAYNRVIEADAYELGDDYKREAYYEAAMNIGVGALFEGLLGGAFKGIHLGVGRAAAARGSDSFQGAQTAWREWKSLDDVRQARQAHEAVAVKQTRAAETEDRGGTINIRVDEEPAIAKSGFSVARGLTPAEVAEQSARGIEIRTQSFANVVRFASDEFDDFMDDPNIGLTMQKQGVEAVVEMGGDKRVSVLIPPKADEPPAAPAAAAPTNPDGSLTNASVAVRGGDFVERIPFEREGVKTNEVPIDGDGKIDRAALGHIDDEMDAAIRTAEEADAILRAADETTPSMKAIYGIQNGKLVMRNTHARGFAEEIRLAYATRNPTAPGILQAVLAGRANIARAAFPPPTADTAARQYAEDTDRLLVAAVENIRREAGTPAIPIGFDEVAQRYDVREIVATIDRLGEEDAHAFYAMKDQITANGVQIENSALARGDLDYAFANAPTTARRADIFAKLQHGHRTTTMLMANSDDFRRSLLKNLEGMDTVAQREAAAKRTADTLDDVGNPATATANLAGQVEVTRIDGERGYKPGYRIARKGDNFVIRRQNVDMFPKSESALVNAVRRGEWELKRKSKDWVARYHEIPKTPFITFFLTGGQSITDRRAWRGAKWRGLKLPEKTKFGRMSKTNRGFGDLGIEVETLRKYPGLINNQEGLTENQLVDLLADGGALADIIEHHFPEVLTTPDEMGVTGVHNYDAVEDGLLGIFRRGLEADMQRAPLMSKADDEFMHGEVGAAHYYEAEIDRLREMGFEPRDPIFGTREMLARDGISYLEASEDQILAAHAKLEAEDKATMELLEKMFNDGFDIFEFYETNKEAVEAAWRARGYQQTEGGVDWVNITNNEDRFSSVTTSSQLTEAVLAIKRQRGELETPDSLADNFRFVDEYDDDIPPPDLEQLGTAETPPQYFDDIPAPTPREILEQANAAADDEWATISGEFTDELRATREVARMGSIAPEQLPKPQNRKTEITMTKGLRELVAWSQPRFNRLYNNPRAREETRAAEKARHDRVMALQARMENAAGDADELEAIRAEEIALLREAAELSRKAGDARNAWGTMRDDAAEARAAGQRADARARAEKFDRWANDVEAAKINKATSGSVLPTTPEPDTAGDVVLENGWRVVDDGDAYVSLVDGDGNVVGRFDSVEEALENVPGQKGTTPLAPPPEPAAPPAPPEPVPPTPAPRPAPEPTAQTTDTPLVTGGQQTGEDGVKWELNGWRIVDDGDAYLSLWDNNGNIVGRYETFEEGLARYIRDEPNGVRDANEEARRMKTCLLGVK